ncbi:MAG: branched-chain amino acid ABC transporter permease [Pseudorhodoplanes sp.]
MTFEIFVLLVQDALGTGAIYVLMALGIVLVFNVTRVIFVSYGDLVAYSALTLGAFELNRMPGTVWLVLTLAGLAFIVEAASLIRRGRSDQIPKAFLYWGVLPALPVGIAFLIGAQNLSLPVSILMTIALVLPLGPLLYRIVFQPIATAPVLVLLMVAVALHFAISGLALLYFGPEGLRTQAFVRGDVAILGFDVSKQLLLIVGAAAIFSAILFVFFQYTLTGKALRATAVNREGARLVGIWTTRAGALAFLLAAAIAAIAGILISPTTTIYYDTGLIVGLKGFVGSVVGGFVSYPLAAVGAIIIGLIESFGSFYSSALKEALVFAAIIPIVLWRWLYVSAHDADEVEDE